MDKSIRLETLARLNNSKLKVFRRIAERTENGAEHIPFRELADELDCSYHVIQYSVHALIEAGLVVAVPGNPGMLRIADGVSAELYKTG